MKTTIKIISFISVIFFIIGCQNQTEVSNTLAAQGLETSKPIGIVTLTPTAKVKSHVTISPATALPEPTDETISDIQGKVVFEGFDESMYPEIYLLDLSCLKNEEGCQESLIVLLKEKGVSYESQSISPDGSKIIYLSDINSSNRLDDVYLFNIDTNKRFRLTNTKEDEDDAIWSPSGKQIAFSSGGLGFGQKIIITNSGGDFIKEIPMAAFENRSPSWSPDETKMVFLARDLARDDEKYYKIFLYDFNTHELTEISKKFNVTSKPQWSPNGEILAYTVASRNDRRDVCLYHFSIQEEECFATNPLFWEEHPSWSPDSKYIVYDEYDIDDFSSTLIIYSLEDGSKTQITPPGQYYRSPKWSSDGKFILCTKRIDEIKQAVLLSPTGGWEIRLTYTDFDIYSMDIWVPVDE